MATEQEAKALTAKLLGIFPAHGEAMEFFEPEMVGRFQEFSAAAGARAVDAIITKSRRLPTIAQLVTELADWARVVDRERRPRIEGPAKRVAAKGNVRNRAATAGMLRALVRARTADDPDAAHDEIMTVARNPKSWPAWLDEHGDDEWKQLPEERKRAVQNLEAWY